jgi:3-carboxy-cis,cis-muconate cycloisomerase
MSTPEAGRLLDALFTTERMRAIFSDRGRVQGMLDFEAALARAEARVGVIPPPAAAAIAACCRAELFDTAALAQGTALAGNPAIPLVRALTALVARDEAEAAGYVHWGATSQDAMDTGLALHLRDALDALAADLARLSAALARIAETHKRTPLAGRTWLQQAVPVTFGLKAAGWMSAVERERERIAALRPRALVIQFGGAAGTLAALGDRGLDVAAALAEELRLGLPDLPWHAQRDRVAEVATTLGLLVGTLGKMARDLALLAQTEVGEAREPDAPGRGGSSTMPQKRNPVAASVALAAAVRVPALVSTMLAAMAQEHERGLGGWQAEWETLPEICALAAGALEQMARTMEGLEVDATRMLANLDLSGGLILAEAAAMALARHVGRARAHELVEQASRRAVAQGRHLREALAEDAEVRAHLSIEELGRAFDPGNYLGVAAELVDRALAARAEREMAGDGKERE